MHATVRTPLVARSLLLAVVATVLGGLQPAAGTSAAAASPVTDQRYFAGANVPWFNWGCDFGCGAKSGVSAPSVNSAVAAGFSRLKTAGVHTVRWWTFEGDASQITRDGSGMPTGLNPAVYADFDAALALASQYDLAYDFVLFSAPTAVPTTWFTNPGQRQRLAEVLTPLFDRYKNNPHILAWEIVNEPEWDIWNDKIGLSDVQATVKLLAAAIHAHTSTSVTLGSANLEGVLMWGGLGLDFYSPHWYDPMSSGLACARCTDVATVTATYGLDGLPIVIGEMYASPSTDALQRLKDFRAKGYAGAWAWSLFNDHTADKFPIDLNAFKTFTSNPGPAPEIPRAPALGAELLANWVSPIYASPGQDITINQDVRTNLDATLLIDFEIFDASNQRIWQTALDQQALSAQTVSSFSATFRVPADIAAGQYVVKTGLFSPGWGTMYSWSDLAGTFVVDIPGPTPIPPSAEPPSDASSSQ